MVMLVLETFALMLVSALLGVAIGRLLGEAYGGDEPTDRPWLRDLRETPPLPALPQAPVLLSDEERDRLSAAAAAPAPQPAAAPPAGAVVAETASAPEPAPAVAPAPAPAPEPSPEDAARAKAADALGTRPAGLAAPKAGDADDLKRIKGIGRQNEARLNALGVWTFAQIAAWTPENVRWVGSFLAFVGRIEREDWVGQAKVLAAGGTTEFATRVDAGDVPTSST